MTLTTFTAGTKAKASEFNNNFIANKLHEVYTGTGFDSTQTGVGNTESSYELTAIDADQLINADYIFITLFFETRSVKSSSIDAYTQLKIQSKDVGGSYSDSLAYFTPVRLAEAGTGGTITVTNSYNITYVHTLTNDEKTNGVQFKIFSNSIVTGASTTAYLSNIQTVLSARYG